jgi:enamine deaminase RidA (YjgF/YER057c/UK114 family)
MHRGNVTAQTHETLDNIEAIVAEASRASSVKYSLQNLRLKVYVRHAGDLAAIEEVVSRRAGAANRIYLQADVCREELLVEIEATGGAC